MLCIVEFEEFPCFIGVVKKKYIEINKLRLAQYDKYYYTLLVVVNCSQHFYK